MRQLMIVVVLTALAALPAAQEPSRAGANWFSYGGDHGGTRFSSLRNAFPRIMHGNFYFRDMLTALQGPDELRPRGEARC